MEEKNGEHPFGDVGQLILLAVYLIIWIGDSFFLHKSTFLSDTIPLLIRVIFLILLLASAIYLSRSGHVVVSHEQRPDGVVATGSFQYVRHPLYLASLLTYLGLTVVTVSLFSLVLLIGMFIFYNYIASYEENLLEKKFGDEYTSYKTATGKWIPRLSKSGE